MTLHCKIFRINSAYDRVSETGSSCPFNLTPVDFGPDVRFRSNNGLGGAKLKLQQAREGQQETKAGGKKELQETEQEDRKRERKGTEIFVCLSRD
jgi:hypothetical protein